MNYSSNVSLEGITNTTTTPHQNLLLFLLLLLPPPLPPPSPILLPIHRLLLPIPVRFPSSSPHTLPPPFCPACAKSNQADFIAIIIIFNMIITINLRYRGRLTLRRNTITVNSLIHKVANFQILMMMRRKRMMARSMRRRRMMMSTF